MPDMTLSVYVPSALWQRTRSVILGFTGDAKGPLPSDASPEEVQYRGEEIIAGHLQTLIQREESRQPDPHLDGIVPVSPDPSP